MNKDYEIKNGWILGKVSVADVKQRDMGLESQEWVRFAIEIKSIAAFREYDGEYEGCSTVDLPHDSFTIAVPFDDMVKIVLGEK